MVSPQWASQTYVTVFTEGLAAGTEGASLSWKSKWISVYLGH